MFKFSIILVILIISFSNFAIYGGEEKHNLSISAGEAVSFLITPEGNLYAWGRNDHGQLGDGSTTNRSAPIRVLTDVAEVSAGLSFTLALRTDGTVWAWGNNDFGQLGDGTTTSSLLPIKVLYDAISISAGQQQSLAIRTDNTLWAWGNTMFNPYANNIPTNSYIPKQIMENIKAISAGTAHNTVIKSDGTLWAWGQNRRGELGDGTNTFRSMPVKILDDVISVSAGEGHTMVIRSDHSLWGWGRNRLGALGNGITEDTNEPIFIMDNVVSVSAGLSYTMVIKDDGSLWAWGVNHGNQFGDFPISYSYTPAKLMEGVVSIASGGIAFGTRIFAHMLAICADGSLWAWGNNEYGQTKDNHLIYISTPTRVIENILDFAKQRTNIELRFVIGQATYYVNNVEYTAMNPPFIDSDYNRTMIPLRLVSEALGAEVYWDSQARSARITKDDSSVAINIGSPLPDGMGMPIIIEGTVFVPLAHIAQQFGITTRWDGYTQSIYIHMNLTTTNHV